MLKIRQIGAMAVLGIGLGAAGGCFGPYTPGGPMASLDQFTYVSTEWQPVTVTVIDTRTMDEIWTTDVPVGQKLTVRFYKDKSEGDPDFPDVMRWEFEESNTSVKSMLANQIAMPSRGARRINVTYRDAPQYHPDSPYVGG